MAIESRPLKYYSVPLLSFQLYTIRPKIQKESSASTTHISVTMNNDEFMNLFSASANNNLQAQAQAPQEPQPIQPPVDHSVWGYFDTQGNYFSPDATFDPLMSVPAPTPSDENETKKYVPPYQCLERR